MAHWGYTLICGDKIINLIYGVPNAIITFEGIEKKTFFAVGLEIIAS